MSQSRKCIATKALLFLASLLLAVTSWAAQVVGKVVNLSGPLLVKKADGTAKVLSLNSAVEQGDTLISEKGTYARIRFIDDSEITLRPSSQLKIDNFVFEEEKQENDNATFSLVKGGLRAVTGALGKRSKEKVGVNTPTATIGIRGTIFIAEYVAPEPGAVAAYVMSSMAATAPATYSGRMESIRSDVPLQPMPSEMMPMRLAQIAPAPDGRPPGLYVQVLNGIVSLTNQGGSHSFTAGQFGFTPSLVAPPVILPANPGIKFEPPPAFSTSPAAQDGSASASQPGNVDCEVR